MHHFKLSVNDQIDFVHPTIEHAAEIYAVIEKNRSYLKRFLTWAEMLTSVEKERQYLQETLESVARGTALLYLIYEKEQCIGMIDLHAWNPTVRKAEIGYWLAEHATGRGIMTAAVHKMCEIAFNDYHLNKIELRADVENIGSQRVAEKSGFRLVGVKHEDELNRDTYISINYYECLKSDFYQ
ncbi:GNAT family N-acetyltransferase [Staphylococcus lutrae]|uniref:GNAT family N-acetyltransferase n=1 Tax=Staphylococcus lutrae TaxID=155085 RepID=A0AAC9RUM4_9STAP|nr:GNAT family N-acetyltransferase [Staphylococcus lutrae]ARJ51132.1 GNAT family N-acetyltransferase [Staphylococcus lutrae]PNZ34809.1 N-acetyltransferase [Staphylococcus lutrae]